MDPKLRIPFFIWVQLIWQLGKRGAGSRESGAFLLSRKSKSTVCNFICYDDLDPHSLESGIIRFDGRGYVPLWKLCSEQRLRVIGDVHTHPCDWTRQSEADRANPMIAQAGHLALILPHFARRSWFGPNGAGLFHYLGEGRWETLSIRSLNFTFL
jgi:proteasome lid subunit RPN8/RPN11